MANKDVLVQVIVASDQEARHVQQALQNLAKNFNVDELIKISKKIENPITKLRIKSML
jgi:mannitol/fructose-specific phosphotransferase system IIA component (Ntr-type)